MELIKSRMCCLRRATLFTILFAASLFSGGLLHAQNTVPAQLGVEIQQLEQRLAANIPPAERHSALVRLARLRQLSGNIAMATANWLDAAAVNPNDDASLVSGAYCLAAIGEWERAASTLRPLLAAGKQGPSILQAQFLDAFLKTWTSTGGGAVINGATTSDGTSALVALAENPEFAALHPMIYYTLWQALARNPTPGTGASGANTAAAESWKARLLAEFPKSPEARAAIAGEKQKDAPSISAVQSPVWLLFPETSGSASVVPAAVTPTAPTTLAAPIAKPVEVAPAAPTPTPSAPTPPAVSTPPPTPPASTASAASTVVLQTGLFSKEANARAQSDALQRAGYTAAISRKTVNGTEYWAVTVPGGHNSNKTIADLKKAGFDSFPIK